MWNSCLSPELNPATQSTCRLSWVWLLRLQFRGGSGGPEITFVFFLEKKRQFVAENGRKSPKMGENRRKWAKIVEKRRKTSKNVIRTLSPYKLF
jgi:hypothetical protein